MSIVNLFLGFMSVVLAVSGFTVLKFVIKSIVFVPARKKAIVERMGQFSRVLGPGWQILYPFESLRAFLWTYVGQDNETVSKQEFFVSTETNSMDPPSTDCVTKDNALVEVDGRVTYKITNLEAAAYDTDDVLNLLYTFVQQATKQVVADMTMQALHGHDNAIGEKIVALVNERLCGKAAKGKDRGVVCESFAIQHLAFDDEVLKKNQQIGAETRQHELNKARKIAEHETLMEVMEMDREKAAKAHQAEYKAKEALLKLQELEATAEAKRKAAGWRVMIDAGFTIADIISLENIAALRETNAKCATRLIIAPHDFITKLWLPGTQRALRTGNDDDGQDNDDNNNHIDMYEEKVVGASYDAFVQRHK